MATDQRHDEGATRHGRRGLLALLAGGLALAAGAPVAEAKRKGWASSPPPSGSVSSGTTFGSGSGAAAATGGADGASGASGADGLNGTNGGSGGGNGTSGTAGGAGGAGNGPDGPNGIPSTGSKGHNGGPRR